MNNVLVLDAGKAHGVKLNKTLTPAFKKISNFTAVKDYYFSVMAYDSVLDMVTALSKEPGKMPVMGMPIEGLDFNIPQYRRKLGAKATLIEPVDNKCWFEIDDLSVPDFDALNPESGILNLLDEYKITADVVWQLSSSQQLHTNTARLHLYLEYDKDYPLSQRGAHAASLGFDDSIQNGVNPCYMAAPTFKQGEHIVDDPIPQRIGFIKGSEKTISMPEDVVIKKALRVVGRSYVDGGVSWLNVEAATTAITTSANFHGALRFISMAQALAGDSADDITHTLAAILDEVPEDRRTDRWEARREDKHLKDLATSAVRKCGSPKGSLNPLEALSAMVVTDEDVKSIEDAVRAGNGWIITGTVLALAAPGGSGKTAIAVNECSILAEEEGYDCFYIDADSPAQVVKEMHELSAEKGFKYINTNIKKGLDPTKIQEMLKSLGTMKDLNNIVIFIDTLKKLVNVIDKGESRALFNILRDVATKGGTVVILSHCTKDRKEGHLRYEGTADIHSDLDSVIFLEGKERKDTFIVSTVPNNPQAKSRFGVPPLTFSMVKAKKLKDRHVNLMPEFIDLNKANSISEAFMKNKPVLVALKRAIKSGAKNQRDIVTKTREYISKPGVQKIEKTLKAFSVSEPNAAVPFYHERGEKNALHFSINPEYKGWNSSEIMYEDT